MAPALAPWLTLTDVFGTEPVFTPRIPATGTTWLPSSGTLVELLTAGQAAVSGRTQVIRHEDTATRRVNDLYKRSGHLAPARVLTYRSPADYRARLGEVAASGRRLVVHHVHAELPPEACWLPPSLLSRLNHKGEIARLVDAEYLARRLVVGSRGLRPAARDIGLPLMVKAATEESTGAGLAVEPCWTPEDLDRAASRFAGSNVVVERRHDFERTWRIQFAVGRDGSVRDLGAAEQVIVDGRLHRGNWLGDGTPPPAAVDVCREAVVRAAAEGYAGFAGLDVGVAVDGTFLVLDANFRMNASTVPLLLTGALRSRHGHTVARFLSWPFASTPQVWRALQDAVDAGALVVLAALDPGHDGQAAVQILALGADRDHAARHVAQLTGARRGDPQGRT